MPAPGPSPRPGPERRDWTPARLENGGEGRGACSSPAAGGQAGSLPPLPPEPGPRRRPLGSGSGAPLRERRARPAPRDGRALQLQEIPEALHHPGAARGPGCQGSPKESHMPAGRAARPRPPPRPTGPGSHVGPGGDGPRRPFPRPGPGGMRGSPGWGLF